MSAPVPPAPPVPLKGEEEKDEDKCVICLMSVPDAKIRPCSHSATCRECAQELINRSEPCPICRKTFEGFDVGVYSNSIGERGLWPTSYKNPRQLASSEGFNEYFRKQFYGNEETFLGWKEVFDVLEIAIFERSNILQQESVEKKKVRGKKKKQQKKKDPRKLEILDACFALGKACNNVRDFDDGRRYF